MAFETWQAFYASALQGVYAPLVVPALFLPWALLAGSGRGATSAEARFVHAYALVFALETLVDPIATGPVAKGLGPSAATGLGLLFVLLGDFRVYLLYFRLSGRSLGPAIGIAAGFTPIVAVAAWLLSRAASAWVGPLPDQALWLIHELLFCAMAGVLRARTGDAFLRRTMLYVLVYYGLWASADILILAGLDAGWGLRVLPNQLYYAFWVPFVYFVWFAQSPAR